jgi:hypothetical protein
VRSISSPTSRPITSTRSGGQNPRAQIMTGKETTPMVAMMASRCPRIARCVRTNPAKAKAMLAEAGYGPQKPLSFELMTNQEIRSDGCSGGRAGQCGSGQGGGAGEHRAVPVHARPPAGSGPIGTGQKGWRPWSWWREDTSAPAVAASVPGIVTPPPSGRGPNSTYGTSRRPRMRLGPRAMLLTAGLLRVPTGFTVLPAAARSA